MRFVRKRLTRTADISRGKSSWQSFLKNALSVVIVFTLGYLALGALAELLAWTIPDRWEARMFSDRREGQTGPAELVRVNETFRRLAEHTELRELPYYLFLIRRSEPNACAIPGGGVGVTRGLIESVESETGLAMVLGHELGHHQQRHPMRRIGRTLVFSLAKIVLFGADGSSVIDASLTMAESGYSRRQERAADAFALRLVHEVYGHTDGSLEFFELVHDEHGTGETRWAAFVRSHPLTSNRIEYMRRIQARLAEDE